MSREQKGSEVVRRIYRVRGRRQVDSYAKERLIKVQKPYASFSILGTCSSHQCRCQIATTMAMLRVMGVHFRLRPGLPFGVQ